MDRAVLPVSKLAGLAFGLPPESRTKMRVSGSKISLETMLLAGILDRLSILIWQNTKDGHTGANRPESVLESLTKEKEEKEQLVAFWSGDDFMTAWENIRRGND